MPVRSDPQLGMACGRTGAGALRRAFSIHSGSFFFAEMSRTTASDRPRFAVAPAASGSDQPYSYRPIPPAPDGSWSCGSPLLHGGDGVDGVPWGGTGRRRRRRRPVRPPRLRRGPGGRGRAWCTRGSRGRGWPAAARARPAGGRTPRSRRRTAAGTPRRRAGRGSAPAQLGAEPDAADLDVAGAGRVSIGGERLRQRLRALAASLAGGDDGRRVARLQACDAGLREGPDGVGAGRLLEEAQGGGGEVVVGGRHRGVPAGRHDPTPGRAAPRSGAGGVRAVPRRHEASASSWSRCLRTPAGVRPRTSASSAAVTGPRLRTCRATRSRVSGRPRCPCPPPPRGRRKARRAHDGHRQGHPEGWPRGVRRFS